MEADRSPGALPGPPPADPGWRTLAAVLPLYATSVLLATYPAVLRCRTRLPVFSVFDPLQHLWIFRWYRSCLIEGRSPLFCPDIQLPVGAPLGLFTPLQLQSLAYLGLSCLTGNDILIYNVILFGEFLFTGMATFALAWYLTRHRWGATVAGLLGMLGTGMLLNAMGGGTELLALGGFPLFLIGWMRFVDRPTPGRLVAAVALYVLLAACAVLRGDRDLSRRAVCRLASLRWGRSGTAVLVAVADRLVRGVRRPGDAHRAAAVPGARLGGAGRRVARKATRGV